MEHPSQKWEIEERINLLQKAIDNIGKHNMQTIRISAHNEGIGRAVQSGDYIDLSNEWFVYSDIKKFLQLKLDALKQILDTLN